MTICGFLFGLSGLLCSLPHFIFDGRSSIDEARKSDNESSDHFLCKADNHTMRLNCDQTKPQYYVSHSGWVVLYITLCYVIQGVAKSPRSPLGSVYLDSSTDKSKTGLYLGTVHKNQHIHVILTRFVIPTNHIHTCIRITILFFSHQKCGKFDF